MGIESTYMKVGKGPFGLIGKTTNERAIKVWANSHHHCNSLVTELKDVINKKSSEQFSHKEEGEGRILSDSKDRQRLQKALLTCVHPFDLQNHKTTALINIYTGEEAVDNVNAVQCIYFR